MGGDLVSQPTFSQVRAALAAQVGTIPGIRAYANRFSQVNPPCAIVMPVTGTLIRYSTTFDGQQDISLQVILAVAAATSAAGQDVMDPFLASTGPQSVVAAIEADSSCGGVVEWAKVTEAAGYHLENFNGIDCLAVHFIVSIGI